MAPFPAETCQCSFISELKKGGGNKRQSCIPSSPHFGAGDVQPCACFWQGKCLHWCPANPSPILEDGAHAERILHWLQISEETQWICCSVLLSFICVIQFCLIRIRESFVSLRMTLRPAIFVFFWRNNVSKLQRLKLAWSPHTPADPILCPITHAPMDFCTNVLSKLLLICADNVSIKDVSVPPHPIHFKIKICDLCFGNLMHSSAQSVPTVLF